MAERLRLGRSHRDTVYLQAGAEPSSSDVRIAVFMGPDAARYAAAFVALGVGHFQPAGPRTDEVRLARVGDVIEHGQPIPGNVVRFTDRQDDLWWRDPEREGLWAWRASNGFDLAGDDSLKPLTVVEVDPEPQPAEVLHPYGTPSFADLEQAEARANAELKAVAKLLDSADVDSGSVSERVGYLVASELRARSAAKETQARLDTVKSDRETIRAALDLRKQRCRDEHGQPAEPDPLVLTLPQVPDGTVALYGQRTGTRYKPDPDGVWRINSWDGDLADVLRREHPEGARVEMAPPPEPRTWPKLDAAPGDISEWVEVENHGRYRVAVRRTMPDNHTTYVHEDDIDEYGVARGVTWTLGRLRELGEVREVLDA